MKVKVFPRFNAKLSKQIHFIALDKPSAAIRFRRDVLSVVRKLSLMPYKNRTSIFFEEDSFRDLIFKGYIIIYNINEVKVKLKSLNL